MIVEDENSIRHTKVRDTRPDVAQTGKYQVADLVIDYDKHQVFVADVNAHLTQNEYKIVALLGCHAGKVITYDYLLKAILGSGLQGNN